MSPARGGWIAPDARAALFHEEDKMRLKKRFLPVVGMVVLGIAVGVALSARLGWLSELGALPASDSGAASRGTFDLQAFNRAFIEVADRATPSIVTVTSEKVVSYASLQGSPFGFDDDFFGRFFQMPAPRGRERQRGMGSGVIVSADGYILTNNHVVANADKVTVQTPDGRRHAAKVIGTDPPTDLAVLKIEAKNLPTLPLGDSDDVKVGEWVIAIGNPFQLQRSVSTGIISAKGRQNVGLADYEDFIQTDAAINPGNSGGALVNLRGEVVGINTAIATRSGANEGIGFAIPMNMAREIMDKLREDGKVVRGWLGVQIQDVDEGMAEAMDLDRTGGVVVGDVIADGPADRAGIERGDVILELNGDGVANVKQLRTEVASTAPGTRVDLLVLRGGRERSITVTLGELPRSEARGPGSAEDQASVIGLSVQELTPELARRLGLSRATAGVVVTDVEPGSTAEDAGIRPGDVILEVDREKIDSVREYRAAISRARAGDTLLFLMKRGDSTFFVPLAVPER
jgi:serine protease Do